MYSPWIIYKQKGEMQLFEIAVLHKTFCLNYVFFLLRSSVLKHLVLHPVLSRESVTDIQCKSFDKTIRRRWLQVRKILFLFSHVVKSCCKLMRILNESTAFNLISNETHSYINLPLMFLVHWCCFLSNLSSS